MFHYLVRDLKQTGLWDDVMVVDLKPMTAHCAPRPCAAAHQGALCTAFEVETSWIVEPLRRKWIDQAGLWRLSTWPEPGKKLDDATSSLVEDWRTSTDDLDRWDSGHLGN
jgi:ribonucleoside-diphosphate reductase alpha chain